MERPPLESFFKSPIQKEDIDTDEVKIRVKRGAKGDKGERGEKGLKGERGERGFNGSDGEKGETGPQGKQGPKGSQGERGFIGEEGKPGKDGIDGKDAENIAIEITPKEIIEKINKSRGEKIKRSKIEGYDDLDNRLNNVGRQVQNIASLGGSRLTNIQSDGVNIGQVDTINFTNGTVAVPTGNNGTTINYTAPTSGGGGSGYQSATGTVNGTNQVFTFATAPNAIVVDQGRVIQKVNSAPDSTINWTGTTTITLSVPPNYDVFAIG